MYPAGDPLALVTAKLGIEPRSSLHFVFGQIPNAEVMDRVEEDEAQSNAHDCKSSTDTNEYTSGCKVYNFYLDSDLATFSEHGLAGLVGNDFRVLESSSGVRRSREHA